MQESSLLNHSSLTYMKAFLRPFGYILGLFALVTSASAESLPQLPQLNWQQRSDWINVKDLGAKGDGTTDDTAAIQSAYDQMGSTGRNRVVYFPPGRYRITSTLTITGDTSGVYLVGHGRDTILEWDGEAGGSMYWSNGVHRSRYEGITYDGKGKAGIGSEHRSMMRYETHTIYENCAFLNLEYGIAVSKNKREQASAEFWYKNCLFLNNKTGVFFGEYNDYDNLFLGCLFADNTIAIHSQRGHTHVWNCNFYRSSQSDVVVSNPQHPGSLRWCTSDGSNRFLEVGNKGRHQSFTIQDCRISNWKDPEGALHLATRGPTLIWDATFTNPPSQHPPIALINPQNTKQELIISSNISSGTSAVVAPGVNSSIHEIPPGKIAPLLREKGITFFQETASLPGKVLDAQRDFSAAGDGKTDDTDALQNLINAAREAGNGAIAYLPTGKYKISRSLEITGGNYFVGGSGLRSNLIWDGEENGVMMRVTDPKNITVEHLGFTNGKETVSTIRQTGTDPSSSIYYNGLYVSGIFDSSPGLELIDLPAKSTVNIGQLSGGLRVADSGQATILTAVHYGQAIIEGSELPKTGFLGFLFHNDAKSPYALTVRDNQNVVIADFYNEQNTRFLLAEGGKGKGPGHISIGGSKIGVEDPQVITINDYEGRIWIGAGFFNEPVPVTIFQQGNRPVDLLLFGSSFWQKGPLFETSPSFTLSQVGCMLIANSYPEYGEQSLPQLTNDTTMKLASDSLDDFRQLGEINLKTNFSDQ
jgi:hypothetical protein